jgi:hypothetical protein
LEALIGLLVQVVSNGLYIDMRRKGKGGFSRFVLFCLGFPFTLLWLFLIKEGSFEEIEERPDDADALLAEIRRDRVLRGGPSEALPPGGDPEHGLNGEREPPGPQGPGDP